MTNRNIMIAPSLLSARFPNLEEDVCITEEAGAELLHLDIMDGHFVPNITFGPAVVKQLRSVTKMQFDTHLMICHPQKYIEKFADAGSDWITLHAECDDHLGESIQQIKDLGIKAGLSVNPDTPFSCIQEHVPDLDMILIMTVYPGFSGQKFMTEVMEKLAEAKKFVDSHNLNIDIEVDGGIGPHNAGVVTSNGGNILVAGSAAYNTPDGIAAAIAAIRQSAEAGVK